MQKDVIPAVSPPHTNGGMPAAVLPEEYSRDSTRSAADSNSGSRRYGSASSRRGSSFSERGEQLRKKAGKKKAIVRIASFIVESQTFTWLTTILTIYALTGEDIKIICFEKPADVVFDWLTLTCLVVFTLEVIISSIGKDDYFLSFFFALDVVSTVTLLLDLQMLASLFSSNQDTVDDLRSSRTARLGAKAGRVVRVLRLVRILKLYKAVYEARQAKKKREEQGVSPGADDDWEDDNVDISRKVNTLQRESRVGKKLSDLTIRRVIILVLTMMICLPLLRVDESTLFSTAPAYGVDVIADAFKKMEAAVDQRAANSSSISQTEVDDRTRTYQQAMLRYIFYFNWYTGRNLNDPYSCGAGAELCSSWHVHHLFWVGFNGPDVAALKPKAALAQIPYEISTEFQSKMAKKGSIYNMGQIPDLVLQQLAGPWQQTAEDGGFCSKSIESQEKDGRYRLGFSMIPVKMEGAVDYAAPCPDAIRKSSRVWYASFLGDVRPTEGDTTLARFDFYFDARMFWISESVNQLYIMVFVCISLCLSAYIFASDANKLVLSPVENMISKVETIRDNPLMAMKMADDEFKAEEMERSRLKRQKEDNNMFKKIFNLLCCIGQAQVEEPMETVILEKTIVKLGSLLALGFGEAGSSIIEHNMSGVDSAGVDAMIAGTRVECIIGATRIQDFSIATEVLQAKVMTFVNQIAEIVHGVVNEFHGAANKNNGDTFLMIWRTSDLDMEDTAKIADMSMLAFSRILGAVHRSQVLAAYRGHPGLQQRLGKNCRVTLSSGLHYGWAIEGAVGSEFKIDASYLSPNVSIAESVERATQIYGVSLLVAESVVRICTTEMASKCRLIDRVIITGSVEPMELHAIDLDYLSLAVEQSPAKHLQWNSRQRFKARQLLEAEKAEKWADYVRMVNFFNENPDIAAMRFRYTLEFIHVFKMGYQNYAQGEWSVARRLLSRTRTMLGVIDGPSAALLRFMEVPHFFEAPEDWKGVRDLGMTY